MRCPYVPSSVLHNQRAAATDGVEPHASRAGRSGVVIA